MVLTNKQYQKWCDRLKLPKQTKEIVSKVRTSEPVRKVKGTARNVHGPYASKKMGRTIQFESHTLELPALTSSVFRQETSCYAGGGMPT